MIRVVHEHHVTEFDEIIEGYGRMIRACVSWAVSEATREKPSECALEWLNDFIPNWREVYANHSRHSFALKSRAENAVPKKPRVPRRKNDLRSSVELRSQGLSTLEIANKLNVSRRIVQRYLAKVRPR